MTKKAQTVGELRRKLQLFFYNVNVAETYPQHVVDQYEEKVDRLMGFFNEALAQSQQEEVKKPTTVETLVREIMQSGAEYALGGDPFKAPEENEEILTKEYDDNVKKYVILLVQSQQKSYDAGYSKGYSHNRQNTKGRLNQLKKIIKESRKDDKIQTATSTRLRKIINQILDDLPRSKNAK